MNSGYLAEREYFSKILSWKFSWYLADEHKNRCQIKPTDKMKDTPWTHGGCTKVRLKGSAIPVTLWELNTPESININRGKDSLASFLSGKNVPSMKMNFDVNLNSTCGIDYLGFLLYCSI